MALRKLIQKTIDEFAFGRWTLALGILLGLIQLIIIKILPDGAEMALFFLCLPLFMIAAGILSGSRLGPGNAFESTPKSVPNTSSWARIALGEFLVALLSLYLIVIPAAFARRAFGNMRFDDIQALALLSICFALPFYWLSLL